MTYGRGCPWRFAVDQGKQRCAQALRKAFRIPFEKPSTICHGAIRVHARRPSPGNGLGDVRIDLTKEPMTHPRESILVPVNDKSLCDAGICGNAMLITNIGNQARDSMVGSPPSSTTGAQSDPTRAAGPSCPRHRVRRVPVEAPMVDISGVVTNSIQPFKM